MDLVDGMKTFVAAVETGSFTAAADRLGISKKLVSKYVAQLEDRLGVRLLHRTTRKLSLTEAGQGYYARCADLIEEIEALATSMRTEGEGLCGTLRISAPSSFGELYVLPLVRDFGALHPDLTIDLRLNDRYVDLAEEGFDLAIRIGAMEDSSMISRRLATAEMWVVATPDFLRSHGTPQVPGDLANFNCIRDTNMRAGQAWPFTVNGQSQRIAVDGKFLVNSATATRRLALGGHGLALCPDYVISADVAAGRLIRVLADFAVPALDIRAVFLNPRHMPVKQRMFMDFLSRRFRECPGWANLNDRDQGRGAS